MGSLILSVLVGSGVGAALGYFGQCSSGTCPLTATWWRGAIYGAVLGTLFYLTSSGSRTAPAPPASGRVPHVSEAEFESAVLGASLPVLVDFYAPWCGPCKALAPHLEKLAEEFEGRAKVVKVNVDDSPKLAERFGIRGVPTLLFFKGGKQADAVVGMTAPAALKARLEKLAAGNPASQSPAPTPQPVR